MCKLCEKKPVYEFTNQRKLCARCFVNYFNKKFLYTLRKFGMIKREDIVGYKKGNDFKGIVLEYLLKFASEKYNFELVRLPNVKATKIADDSSLDSESENIVTSLIKGSASELKSDLPVEGKIIKPLYLFLDEEILLYARLKHFGFTTHIKKKKDKIENFLDEFEKKHPEVKRAVVNSLLEMYRND
ncbi:MAG: hypothetical protein PHQ66_01825 [Candidatus Nanoarchaeia archaeon]|nr:hypothetical protein [Candidatus Nanoarchaeia archaeon]MDD5357887.1 hypothetical protein [Candidatus Nanoarchaeia archaeon]MDD5588806.1 hypothetical protein [Candidatus Nanoarchaeia archaeon]